LIVRTNIKTFSSSRSIQSSSGNLISVILDVIGLNNSCTSES
jgi:hypothetical protein